MPKFDELEYNGCEITCSLCKYKAFYTNFKAFANSDNVEYEWSYQCQDCGEVKMSKTQHDERPYLVERCKCDGQFRRDKNIFCRNCKEDKTSENISDEFISFKDKNGEVNLFKHPTTDERKGKVMSKEEIHLFSVDLIIRYLKSKGFIIISVDYLLNGDNPNIIVKSVNDNHFYIVVETTAYPILPESIFRNEFPNVVKIAKLNDGKPVFAGISLANMLNEEKDFGNFICGSLYAVSFKNLFHLV